MTSETAPVVFLGFADGRHLLNVKAHHTPRARLSVFCKWCYYGLNSLSKYMYLKYDCYILR